MNAEIFTERKSQPLWSKLGLKAPKQLLCHYPRRYEDRARWMPLHRVPDGETLTARGTVRSIRFPRWRGAKPVCLASITLRDSIESLDLLWFNMPFLRQTLSEGQELIVHGRLQTYRGERRIVQPEFELVRADRDSFLHLDRIVPIYTKPAGLNQRQIRRAIHVALCAPDFHEPDEPLAPRDYMPRADALRAIHFPDSFDQLAMARRRLAFDELLEIQVVLALRRAALDRVRKKRGSSTRQGLVDAFLSALPFTPTASQSKVFGEIDADLAKPRPMNRLLQGDVGSGKTLVAFYALLRALESGCNAAFMAPTETLALQHFERMRAMAMPLGVDAVIRTGSRKSDSAELFAAKGTLYIGTHALFQENADIRNLGLVVIDEQHKFGVAQRQRLLEKGDCPDLLVMTATPIPRTYCLTLYGDLDLSVLSDLPPGRMPVETSLCARPGLSRLWSDAKKEIARGMRIFVVFPAIEESEKIDLRSLEQGCVELREIFGEDLVIELHGRMDPSEKEKRMRLFREGKRPVLAATSVIEVGVDVPEATLIVVERADRFGLAQLHQLRGRVGRSKEQARCVLVADPSGQDAWRRLKIMTETTNGFLLAEEDFRIRGPGNILGSEQSGLPPLSIARLPEDLDILAEAKSAAEKIVAEDPGLEKHRTFEQRLGRFAPGFSASAAN